MRSAHAGAAGILFLLILGAGCTEKMPMGEVSGQVNVDGQLMGNGAILFIPADSQAPTTGGVIEEGKYATRVPLGKMKVSISMPKVVGKKKIYPTPNSPEMPITVEGLPARYNDKTNLTIEVERGKNQKDFTLSTR